MGKPFDEWFQGPWQLVDRDTLVSKTKLAPGEIMAHRTGAVLLNCPACNSMQIGRVVVTGSKEIPTLSDPIHCGKGYCDRCGIWFKVSGGKTLEAQKPAAPVRAIPEKLRRAGVVPPPSLDVALRRRAEELRLKGNKKEG